MPQTEPCVYVVRHGETELNSSNCFRGKANPPLNDKGIKQAHKLASLFENIAISHIFCSDKQRATKTAEIISQAHGNPVHPIESLRALNVGDFSGKPRTPESEAALQKYLDKPDTQIPGGESLNDFKARIQPCLEEAIEIYMKTGLPPMFVAHSSIVHEVGDIANKDHRSVLVEPGGAIAVFYENGKISAHPIFKPLKDSGKSHAETIT
jgi:broad specificity phosphatase PhoE